MLSQTTLDHVDGYWAAFLGVPRGRLRPAKPLLVAHTGDLDDYGGMYAQSFGAPVVSLPAWALERYGRAAAEAAGAGLVHDGRWHRVFGGLLDVVIGPAHVLYADAGTLRLHPADARVRTLDEADRPAVERLKAACGTTEWEHGGSDPGRDTVIGAFVEGALAAVAGYEVWGGRIAHLAIVTHPAHRGCGLGTRAVEGALRAALWVGLVPQYRALADNAPSLRIAERLGFVPHSTSLAVRLRAPSGATESDL
ncbi:GNAT family N-acetyltransferase [Longimicrobium sp.]|uniref:GNAT family N-acetyltransferase n=1 Tax=Longimicrobium sp. TaxID=2029185 RepID=UPI003B39FE45